MHSHRSDFHPDRLAAARGPFIAMFISSLMWAVLIGGALLYLGGR